VVPGCADGLKVVNKTEVLYEDKNLIAVNKPPGLLSVPGRGPDKSDCAVSRAALEFGWIREVHRLDQATSGILLLARTPEAHRKLSASFASREVEKKYIALTAALPADPQLEGVDFETGVPERDSGRITLYQRLDPENRPHQIIDPEKGKEAVTGWMYLPDSGSADEKPARKLFRMELVPLTGRTHQLRLALSICGAAIPGDSLYADEEIRISSSRLLLHAAELRFTHPVSGLTVEIKTVIPF